MEKLHSQLTIKQAEREDLLGVATLFNNYRVFYQQESDLDLANTFISARLNKLDSVIFIAKSNKNEYLGFCQMYPSFSSVSAQATWILNDLFVIEAYRRHGIAKQLLEQAKTLAQHSKTKGISLMTTEINYQAQKLYLSTGYQRQNFLSYFLPVSH